MQNIEIQIGGAELTPFLIRVIGDARMILKNAGVRGGQKNTFTVTTFI